MLLIIYIMKRPSDVKYPSPIVIQPAVWSCHACIIISFIVVCYFRRPRSRLKTTYVVFGRGGQPHFRSGVPHKKFLGAAANPIFVPESLTRSNKSYVCMF